jgi:hypothetical protein
MGRGGESDEARAAQTKDWQPSITPPEIFDSFATGMERMSPGSATVRLLRACVQDELAQSLISDRLTWDAPHRLLAAVRWLVYGGEVADFFDDPDPWPPFRDVLENRAEWVRRFVREQTVQTNQVQRCWVLLPLFLTVAGAADRPLDLVELGTSGALNLYWDRYRYSYAAGGWGDPQSPLHLIGEERAPFPSELLGVTPRIRKRIGIDLNPIDVTREEGIRLLRCFDTRDEHRVQVEAAAAVVRAEPPELLCGDYLDLLPDLLRQRDDSALTVVFQTISTVYLTDEQRGRLRRIIDGAASEGPLAWISTPTPEEHGQRRGDYPLELALWPGMPRHIAARMNTRGEWIEWQS